MKKKSIQTKYRELLGEVRRFRHDMIVRREPIACFYDLVSAYNLRSLADLASAANLCGYDTIVSADADRLSVRFRERVKVPDGMS